MAETEAPKSEKGITNRRIEEEMKENYIDYAMSVIIGRALPDVRDGLKPVHRRILFSMHELGLLHSRPYRKCARIVGDVLGKYHPHGDQAVYDSLVRMAQWFSLRYLLVDGQGNFGSIDGDPAAAMRYTEARFSKIAEEMLRDIEKNTVDFVPNFDGSAQEPSILPNRIPNLLINGSSGIAVGMATNMPPHNIGEVCDAMVMLIDNPETGLDGLMQAIKGPDFPTGGIICGLGGVVSAYKTGRGMVKVRAVANVEDGKIVVTEIPYMVNKSSLIEKIAELVKDKRIEGIRTLRDESDRDGLSIVIEVTQGTDPELVLNKLYQHTDMESTFGIINLALVDNRPKILTLRDMLISFIRHRKDIITRRTMFDLQRAEERSHILEGLLKALARIDAVIKLIKGSRDPKAAREGLVSGFGLSEKQADAILQMRLQTLTGLEQGKIREEQEQLLKDIEKYKKILGSEAEVMAIIRDETIEIREKFADERKTKISGEIGDICDADLVQKEEVVITITNKGYVKRIPAVSYRMQRRGGKGITATGMDEDGFVRQMFTANTHDYILFFSDRGKVHWMKAYGLPTGSRYSRGKAIVNYLALESGEKISTAIPVKEFSQGKYVIFSTKKGTVKKTPLEAYSRPRKGGIIAISLREGDELIDVEMTDGSRNVFLATKNGYAIKFAERDVRETGRSAAGVRGIRLREKDEVVGMEIILEGEQILTVSEKGYGKRTEGSLYKLQGRGGKGVTNLKITGKNGRVKAIKKVTGGPDEQAMIISNKGTAIRVQTSGISIIGRATQGVRIMRLEDGDTVEDMAIMEEEDKEGVVEKVDDEEETDDTEEAVGQIIVPDDAAGDDETPESDGHPPASQPGEEDDDMELEESADESSAGSADAEEEDVNVPPASQNDEIEDVHVQEKAQEKLQENASDETPAPRNGPDIKEIVEKGAAAENGNN